MIKSTIRKRTYRAIYRLLDRVSPVDYDCGTLCGAACCMVESEPDMEMGIYLSVDGRIHGRVRIPGILEGEGVLFTLLESPSLPKSAAAHSVPNLSAAAPFDGGGRAHHDL